MTLGVRGWAVCHRPRIGSVRLLQSAVTMATTQGAPRGTLARASADEVLGRQSLLAVLGHIDSEHLAITLAERLG